jgi:hypothetical protein
MNIQKNIEKFVTNIRDIIEEKLKEQLHRLGVPEDKSILKKYCRRMILPSKYNVPCVLEKYYFDNILILIFERDNDMNYAIVAPLEYNKEDKQKVKNILNT